MNIDLSNRVVLITGGSRGIVRRTALLMAECGARVALTFASRQDAAWEVVAAIGPDRALAIRADAGVPSDLSLIHI